MRESLRDRAVLIGAQLSLGSHAIRACVRRGRSWAVMGRMSLCWTLIAQSILLVFVVDRKYRDGDDEHPWTWEATRWISFMFRISLP